MPAVAQAAGTDRVGIEAGLATLAGLAPSAVLRRRLERAEELVHALDRAGGPPRIGDPGWAALLDAVTVQETRLFRAAPQLLALGAMLPAVPASPLRMLSAGCASGEEAWSLSILAEAAGLAAEVVGIDLCRPALEKAEAGRYPAGPPDALREVPPPLRGRFAERGGLVTPLSPAPRFRRASLLALPEDLGAFGVILCRNVLIYLLPAARQEALRALVARLRPGGALLLGPTDSPDPDLPLEAVPGAHGIWRRLR